MSRSNTVRNAVTNGSPSRPYPTRPDPAYKEPWLSQHASLRTARPSRAPIGSTAPLASSMHARCAGGAL